MGGIIAGIAARNLVGPLIAGAVAFGVGFGACEAYEHKAPWGLAHQRDKLRDSIPGKIAEGKAAGIKAQADADKAAFGQWSASLAECRAARENDTNGAARDLDKARAFTSSQAAAAYRLGRATCSGGGNAKKTDPATGGGQPGDGGVRPPADFRTIFGGGAVAAPEAHPLPARRPNSPSD